MAFFVFEGLDGSGKSTLMENLRREFERRGRTVKVTREPGGSILGDAIRELLLRPTEVPTPEAELFLYEAGRAQHVTTRIQPWLQENFVVLCDRFSASSVAFQFGGRGLPRAMIDTLNVIATQGLEPDLTILLDLSVEEAQRRMSGRDQDRFETEAQEFHERVRRTYLELADENSNQWLVLDAKEPVATLNAILLEELERRGFFQ
jgi:dTMP kinase